MLYYILISHTVQEKSPKAHFTINHIINNWIKSPFDIFILFLPPFFFLSSSFLRCIHVIFFSFPLHSFSFPSGFVERASTFLKRGSNTLSCLVVLCVTQWVASSVLTPPTPVSWKVGSGYWRRGGFTQFSRGLQDVSGVHIGVGTDYKNIPGLTNDKCLQHGPPSCKVVNNKTVRVFFL